LSLQEIGSMKKSTLSSIRGIRKICVIRGGFGFATFWALDLPV